MCVIRNKIVVNIYNLLNIKRLSNIDLPSAKFIETTLNEIITPELNKIGLENNSYKYLWTKNYNSNEIKPIIRFSYRGLNGNLMIGNNFKFIPILNENGSFRKNSSTLHLFENLEFFDTKNKISLWNDKFFKKSIEKIIKTDLKKIENHLNSYNSIEKNIEIAQRQTNNNSFQYDIRFPNPKYILAFLYARVGEKEKGIKILQEFLKENKIKNTDIIEVLSKIKSTTHNKELR